MPRRPFPVPSDVGPVLLEAEEREVLSALTGPVVAVTQDDVVAFATPPALELVGWDSTLIGLPLTTIIPRRLQPQHLAAFERYVKTGVSKLQGHPVRVPARRRDGGEVIVDLTIRVFRRPNGTMLAVAALDVPVRGKVPPALEVLESAFRRRMYDLV